MDQLKAVQEYGQSIWIDFIRRDLLVSGQLKQMVEEGIRGMTSNPTIFHKAIAQSNDYDDALRAILKSNPDANAKTLYDRLTIEDIQMAADILRPVYEASDGVDGLVSLEASPHLAYDTDGTITEVRRLWQLVGRLIIALVSLIIMPILAWQKYKTGKQIGSMALVADSKETWACAFLSAALLLGLGSNYLFGFWQADPIVGLIIVAFLFREGWESWRECSYVEEVEIGE